MVRVTTACNLAPRLRPQDVSLPAAERLSTDERTVRGSHHELSREVLRRRGFERVQDDVAVQGVARNDAPVVEDLRAECLSLR